MRASRANTDTAKTPCVIYISASGHLAGPARSLLTILRTESDALLSQVLVAPEGKLLNEAATIPGLTTVPMPLGRRFRRVYRLRGSLVVARQIWNRRRSLAAVHANGLSELNMAGLGAAVTRSHVVVWSHASVISGLAPRMAKVWQRAIRRLDWVAVSDDAVQALEGASVATSADIIIVPNPISAAEVVKPAREHSGPFRIGFLSGANRSKGFDVLVDAAGILDGLQLEWWLFTNLDSQRADADLVDAARRHNNIIPKGHVSDVAAAFAQLDVVFVPSRRESFGRVAAEAMLNGLPVVASDIPAMRRLIGNDAGLLFRPGEAGAAAEQIRRIVTDAELRRRLGQASLARARVFDPDEVRGSLDTLYGVSTA